MSEVLFIRHAESELSGTFCGHSNPELSERGRRQIDGLLAEIANDDINLVYSSDLRRAHATAQAIADSRGLAVHTMAELREIHFGDWEGLTWSQIETRDPDHAARWIAQFPSLAAPHGEVFAEFEARVLNAVDTILNHAAVPVAIVSHGGPMRVVLQRRHGLSEQEAWARTKAYCSIIR